MVDDARRVLSQMEDEIASRGTTDAILKPDATEAGVIDQVAMPILRSIGNVAKSTFNAVGSVTTATCEGLIGTSERGE